jgi:foldase protein PrsA
MTTKAKTRSSLKIIKKTTVVTTPQNQTLSNSISLLTALKNKKFIGMIAVIVILVILAFAVKSVFIAATVNGEPITRLSVVSTLEKQGGKTVLDSLITKTLILQEAKKENISITQSDIDAQIKKITASLKTQGMTLDQALTAKGLTKADLNDELKIELSIDKMVGTDIPVTAKEIDDFVATQKSQMPEGTTDAQFRAQETIQLKQQKLQIKTNEFIKNLQDKAKITHFVSY